MSSVSEEIDNTEYITTILNPLLEPLVLEVFIQKPRQADLVGFMVNWLNNEGSNLIKQKEQNNSFSEEDEDTFDEVHDLPKTTTQTTNFRQSVSAESYGEFNKRNSLFVPKLFPKTEEALEKLNQIIDQTFLFSTLEEKDKKKIEGAFEPIDFNKGATVIKEGDDGDFVYVVFSGQLSCYKNNQLLKKYQGGETFGELALLYNAPRAATIISDSDSQLFRLDRETFSYIVKVSAQKKRAKYEQFLNTVEILSSIAPDERLKIADVLKKQVFQNNEYVVKEGEQGDKFYLIESGNAIATKTLSAGKPAEKVFSYKQGDYFGELALLKNTPRAANVIAQGTLEVVSIDRDSFKRLLGPLADILKRNFSQYEKYLG